MAQAEMRSRPLARRAARIERPARVRIRARKPWFFARRRLLGWNVRFMIRLLAREGPEPLQGRHQPYVGVSRGVKPTPTAPVKARATGPCPTIPKPTGPLVTPGPA